MCSILRTHSGVFQGWVVKGRGGRGFFWVEWHTMCDLAALKTAMGVEGEGSKKYPCILCKGTYEEMQNLEHAPFDERVLHEKDRVFPIPAWRMHACSMHCHHRITERILQKFMEVLFYALSF